MHPEVLKELVGNLTKPFCLRNPGQLVKGQKDEGKRMLSLSLKKGCGGGTSGEEHPANYIPVSLILKSRKIPEHLIIDL